MLKFSYGCCFTFIQGFVCLALIYMNGFTAKQMFNPWKTYVKLSAVLFGSHVLTKGYLAFLSYPAQIMSKSTKVLPVMIMAAFIPGLRKYPLHEYVSAILLVVGLIQFTLEDASTCPNLGIIGVMMIFGPYGALIMDSLGNLHEAFFTLNLETTQVILKSSFIVLVLLLQWKAVQRLGATFLHGNSYDEAQSHTRMLVENNGQKFIPPFDHPHIITGQGTFGMENYRQFRGAGPFTCDLCPFRWWRINCWNCCLYEESFTLGFIGVESSAANAMLYLCIMVRESCWTLWEVLKTVLL